MTDLDDEAQAKIEEMMFNERQKKMGLPLEQHTIHSKDDLVRAATSIWYSISNVYISNLYRFQEKLLKIFCR
jgi:hypothetical protein